MNAASTVRDARVALAFLTRLPVGPAGAPLDSRGLSRAARWFPLVGVAVAGVMIGVRLAAGLVLDPAPATVLAVLAAMLMTGGLHEDGLADVADGLGAHVPPARRLEILKDSRVGTYGALAAAFMVLFPVAVLAPLDGADFARAAVVAHVLSRWSILAQARLLHPASPLGSGAMVRVSTRAALATGALCVALALAAGGLVPGGAAVGATVLFTPLACGVFRRGLGGSTGDTFGALAKAVELAGYAALAAALG